MYTGTGLLHGLAFQLSYIHPLYAVKHVSNSAVAHRSSRSTFFSFVYFFSRATQTHPQLKLSTMAFSEQNHGEAAETLSQLHVPLQTTPITLSTISNHADYPSTEHSTSHQETGHEYLFHGSCSRCHHLHSAFKLCLSTNERRHKRYPCENCKVPLFGIGRTSTQSSLASLETVSSLRSSRSRRIAVLTSIPACSNHVEDISLERRDPSSIVQGTLPHHGFPQKTSAVSSSQTRVSAVQGRPAEQLFYPEISPVRERLTSDKIPIAPPKSSHLKQEATIPAQSGSLRTSAARKVLDHLKTKFQWRRIRSRKVVKNVGTMTDELAVPIDEAQDFPGSAVDEEVLSPSMDEPHPDVVDTAEHRAHHDELADGEWDPLKSKRDRLRVQRRQATLKYQCGQQRICLCDEGCHCMGSKGSTTPRSIGSRALWNIPQHQLDHLLREETESLSDSPQEPARHHSPARHVAFAGAHVEEERRDCQDPAGGRLTAEEFQFSRQSTSTSTTVTSQATTAIDSSSSGGRSSRQQSQRASSLPLQPFIELLNQYIEQARPEVLTALREYSAVHPPQLARTFPEDESLPQASSRTACPHAESQNPTPPRASTTSLSHLSDPSDVLNSPASDGAETQTTSGAATIIRRRGSSDLTPQTHAAANCPPPTTEVNSDELSSEIAQLEHQSHEA